MKQKDGEAHDDAANKFEGAQEFSLPFMTAALLGHVCTVYPGALRAAIEDADREDASNEEDKDDGRKLDVLSELRYIAELMEKETVSSNGAKLYRVDEKPVFVTDVEMYKHRGPAFQDMNAIEYACIVEIIKKQTTDAQTTTQQAEGTKNTTTRKGAGRRKRKTFELGSSHPLVGHYQAVIRPKLLTATLGGEPCPPYPTDTDDATTRLKKLDDLAKFLLPISVPWKDHRGPDMPLNAQSLLQLIKKWDSRSATLVDQGRYRMMANIMQSSNCEASFETTHKDHS